MNPRFHRYAFIPFLMLIAPECNRGVAAAAAGTELSEREARMFAASAGYEQFMGRWSRLLASLYIRFAGVKEGDRVLDVGTGTGSLASSVAAAFQTSEVVGIDPSEAFVGHARSRGDRVRYRLGDAQSIDSAAASFDHVMSLLVLNFIPDHLRAVAEMRRVTRPGGQVSACVWDYDAGMQMLRYFWDEAVALDPNVAAKDERNMKLAREGQLAALWQQAGLVAVQQTALTVEQRFTSFADYWAPFMQGAGPAGAYVASLSSDHQRRLEARIRSRLLGGREDGAIVLQARAWCVRGQVP